MKKIFLFMLAAFTISSCVKDVDPTSYEQTKDQVLTDNFNTTFGVTESQYANHRWGMNTMPLIEIPMSSSNTMRAAYTNANQWEWFDYVIPADITESEIEKVKAVFLGFMTLPMTTVGGSLTSLIASTLSTLVRASLAISTSLLEEPRKKGLEKPQAKESG